MMTLRGLLPVILTAALLASAVQRPAGAQPPDSTRAGETRDSTALSAMRPAALTRPVHSDATSRVIHAAHDGLIGVGIGAAAGVLTGLILEHLSRGRQYTDHSEDGLVVAVAGIDGSLFGLVVGAIVGLARSP